MKKLFKILLSLIVLYFLLKVGIKYLGNLKNSDLVVSIFKSGQVKFLDVVPIDVITDMSKMMDKMVLKAHV